MNPPLKIQQRCRAAGADALYATNLATKKFFCPSPSIIVRNTLFLSFFLCNFSSFLCGLLLLSTHPSIQSNRQWQLFAYISLYLSCQWFAKFFEWPEIISDLIRGEKNALIFSWIGWILKICMYALCDLCQVKRVERSNRIHISRGLASTFTAMAEE